MLPFGRYGPSRATNRCKSRCLAGVRTCAAVSVLIHRPYDVALAESRLIPAARRADWYARRVGVAAAREINEIPAARQATDESRVRAAGMSSSEIVGATAGLSRKRAEAGWR